jgi:Fe-S-cluster containining protein
MTRGKALPVVQAPPPPTHIPGPTELALAALWRDASAQFFSPRNILRQLRLRRRFDLEPVRLEKLRVAIPTAQVPDCDNCLDLCCTGENAVVSLRLRDVAVLRDLGREDLITHERPAPPPPKKASWARREADGSVFHRAFPVLARDATGTCRALNEDRLCGLWPSWPLSCARYPYALDRRNGVIFYAAGCRSTRLAPVGEAPIAVRALVRAVVDAYNERLRDVMLLAFAREELRALGLLQWVKEDALEGL